MGHTGTGALDRHDNNFDFFRLLAAVSVIFYHSFPLAGIPDFHIFGVMGVSVFFIISGYFITQSWHNRPSLVSFAWSRFLRLVPALSVVVLFTMLVIGPLVTELPLAAYLTNYRTWLYALNVPLMSSLFKLPGVFVHNFYPYEPNGSIWTLHIEARMYVAVVLLGLAGLMRKKHLVALATLFYVAVFVGVFELGVNSTALSAIAGLPFLVMRLPDLLQPLYYVILFMAGSLLYIYKDVIKYDRVLFIGATVLWAFFANTQYFYTASIFLLPYLVICLGFMKLPVIGKITGRGDYSYGLYIFAWPIQQTVAHFFPAIGPWGLFAASLPLTFMCAIISWNLVESKALKLKKADPRQLLKKASLAPIQVIQNQRRR